MQRKARDRMNAQLTETATGLSGEQRTSMLLHAGPATHMKTKTIVVAIHGILTGQTEPSWPDRLDAWMWHRDPDIKVLKKEYRAGPFPRWNCLVTNPLLARALAERLEVTGRHELHDDGRQCGSAQGGNYTENQGGENRDGHRGEPRRGDRALARVVRGALALALALGLPPEFPNRQEIIAVSFAVVAFSILVQGLTIMPLMRRLGELPNSGTGQ